MTIYILKSDKAETKGQKETKSACSNPEKLNLQDDIHGSAFSNTTKADFLIGLQNSNLKEAN